MKNVAYIEAHTISLSRGATLMGNTGRERTHINSSRVPAYDSGQ